MESFAKESFFSYLVKPLFRESLIRNDDSFLMVLIVVEVEMQESRMILQRNVS